MRSVPMTQAAMLVLAALPAQCSKMAAMQQRPVVTWLYLMANMVCSIAIVLLNKWVYVHVGFPNVTLTLLHLLTTWAGLYVCQRCHVFHVKCASLRDLLPLSATFCGFVVFTNLSLQMNAVGTFQLAKALTTPCIIVIQMLVYGKHFCARVKLTLIPIALGVFLNFWYDLQFSVAGTACAAAGVLVTSFYQVLVSRKQHGLQMDAMQLLYQQAPLSALLLTPVVPVVEPLQRSLARAWAPADAAMVSASCVIAFFVNISIYWIIGHTSPLTYNMVGHLKFCLTALGGVLLFEDPLQVTQGVGIVLTVVGVTAYAHVKLSEPRPPSTVEEGYHLLPRKM